MMRIHQSPVALLVGWVPLCDLLRDKVRVAVIVERSPLVIKNAVKGIAGHKLDIVLAPAPCQLPYVVKHEWRSDDRRAAVELEPLDLVDVAPTARLVSLFKYLDLVSLVSGDAHRCAQPPKTTPDDDYFWHFSLPSPLAKTMEPVLAHLSDPGIHCWTS
jgi:hypothetical protein